MKKLIFLILFSTNLFSFAQKVDPKKVTEIGEEVKKLYNEKNFKGVYALTAPSFREKIKENDFADFLGKSVYVQFGVINQCEYLKEENGVSGFILRHVNGNLKMNLSFDENYKLTLFELQPFEGMPKVKRQTYLSDNKLQTSLDSIIEKTVKDYMQSPQNCGLSIGIYKDGKEYFYNYGEVKRDSKVMPTNASIFEIGSISKTFCGILLAQAISEKKVSLNDDIRKYLPEKKYKNLEMYEAPIQLVHLANHTSGLPRVPENIDAQPNYDPMNPYKNYSKEMIFNYLEKITLSSEPGKNCEYSNLGMALLGVILEKVYNKSFEELVKEKIATPFAMKNTGINLSDEQQKLFTTGYNSNGMETPHWDLGNMAAAGGIRSNTNDMLLYLEQNMKESNEALKLAHQSTFNNGSNVALSWHLLKTKQGNNLIWHNGGTYGYSSFCGFIKEKNSAVVVLSNSGVIVDPIALSVLRFLQK